MSNLSYVNKTEELYIERQDNVVIRISRDQIKAALDGGSSIVERIRNYFGMRFCNMTDILIEMRSSEKSELYFGRTAMGAEDCLTFIGRSAIGTGNSYHGHKRVVNYSRLLRASNPERYFKNIDTPYFTLGDV